MDAAITTLSFGVLAVTGYTLHKNNQLLQQAQSGTLKTVAKLLDGLSQSSEAQDLTSKISRNKAVLVVSGVATLGGLSYALWKRKGQIERQKAKLSELSDLVEEMEASSRTRIMGDGDEENEDYRTCVICIIRNPNVALIPCGHLCLCLVCVDCIEFRKGCPICRQAITGTQNIFDV